MTRRKPTAPDASAPTRQPVVTLSGPRGETVARCLVPDCEWTYGPAAVKTAAAEEARWHRVAHRRAFDEWLAVQDCRARDARLVVLAAGVPRPQGSLRAVGKGRVIAHNQDDLMTWRGTVAAAARRAAVEQAWQRADWPLRAWARFVLPTQGREPDLDKLVRAVGDALTDAGTIWTDDRVVAEWVATRHRGPGPCLSLVLEHVDGSGGALRWPSLTPTGAA